MTNIIFIENAPYAGVKKALLQWIALYEDLDPAFNFMLYEDVAASSVIIKADEKLSNEHFAYLVNYLKYPEGISYKASLNGHTEITEENFFPAKLSGIKIMLFIPDSDTEYDNVHWVTEDSSAYKTDMGGKTIKTEPELTYQQLAVDINSLTATEILQRARNNPEIQKDEDKNGLEEKIARRMKILLVLNGSLLLIGFIYRGIDFDISFSLYFVFIIGITSWFMTDYKMLRVTRFYNLSYLIAAMLVFYGYFFAMVAPHPDLYQRKLDARIFTFLPLVFLSVQKAIRMIFLIILKKEPVIEKPMPALADFLYFLLLFVFTILALFAIRPIVE